MLQFLLWKPIPCNRRWKEGIFLIELKDSCLPVLVTVAISICNCYKGLRKGVGVCVCLFLKCLTVHSVCFARDTVIVQF